MILDHGNKVNEMPMIFVDGPKIDDLESKRNFVRKITDAAASFYNLPEQTIIVTIKENPPENVGVGGELIVDRRNRVSGN